MEILTHAMILSGDGETTRERARELAAAALCEGAGERPCRSCRHCRKVFRGDFPGIHPDVTVVSRGVNSAGKPRREIVVDQIRALVEDASVLPNEAAGKVYILPEADTMNENAQNAFLKLLEEPPAGVRFLLCAERTEALLPTVRSRCSTERGSVKSEEYPEDIVERARGFLTERNRRSELLRWSTAVENLDNAAMLSVVRCARALLVHEKSPAEELLFLSDFLAVAEKYLLANVGVKHVCGYLATYLYDGK